MENIIIYTKRSEAENVINIFKKEFLINKFPLSILKHKDMEFMFVNSKVFYLKYCYDQFLLFLAKNNVNHFYILPSESDKYDWREYEKEHLFNKKTKYNRDPVFLIKNQPSFDSIDQMFMRNYFLHFTEYYVFSEKLDWVIHYVPHRNFIILYFGKEILFEGLGLIEDKIVNIDKLIENSKLEDGFNKKEIESLKNYWFPKINSFQNDS